MTLAIKVDFPRTQLGKARWISNTDGDTPRKGTGNLVERLR